MPKINLFLFGSPRVICDGQEVDIGLRKATALLAYLLVTKQSHSRDTLAALFWPESDNSTSRANLRRAIYRVNRAVEADILLGTRDTVELNPHIDLQVDVDDFRNHAEACLEDQSRPEPLHPACVSRLTEAADLYTGGFLEGFSLPDSPAFDEWQFFQAENYRQTCAAILSRLSSAHQEGEDWDSAIEYVRRLLMLDPLDESVHRRLMELYALSDQQEAALRQYEQCCKRLSEELDISPDEETRRLFERIKRRKPLAGSGKEALTQNPSRDQGSRWDQAVFRSPQKITQQHVLNIASIEAHRPEKIREPGPLHNLPAQSSPFFGRKQDIVEIRRLLIEDPNFRLLTLTGPGGIGKTRLALEAASQVKRFFPDGVYFISFVSVGSAEQFLPAIAKEIGFRFYEGGDAKGQLIAFLRRKHMLLILDNFEHMQPAAELVANILKEARMIRLLVTSRERLNLSAETIFKVGGLSYPTVEEREDILSYEAVQLLVQNARLVRPHLRIEPEDFSRLARICRLVQGMPLALVLAAGWVNVLTFEEIAGEISHSLDILQSENRDMPERQLNMRAAFSYSWDRLSQGDQRVFMRLTVFRGGFTRQAAERVAGADLKRLRSLIDKSFVVIRRNRRYEIHEVLRQYGEEQLEHSGQSAEVRTLHSEYFLELLSRRTMDMKGSRQDIVLTEVEQDFKNIRAAWNWALQREDFSLLAPALEGLFLFCDIRGRQQEGAEMFKSACSSLDQSSDPLANSIMGAVMTRLGMLQSRYLRGCAEIGELIERGLDAIGTKEDDGEQAFGLLALGHFYADSTQDVPTAIPYFERSLQYYTRIGDDYYIARALHLIGHCHIFITGMKDFVPYAEQALKVSQRTGDKANMALLQVSLSMAAFFLGRFHAAQTYAQECLPIANQIGAGPSLSQTHNFLGILYLLQGQRKRAKEHLERGSAMSREVNFPVPLVYAEAALALQAVLDERLSDALHHVCTAEAHPVDPYALSFVHFASAVAHASAGDFSTARLDVEQVFALDKQLGSPSIAVQTLPVQALILAHEGHSQQAVEVIELFFHHPLRIDGWSENWSLFKKVRADLEND